MTTNLTIFSWNYRGCASNKFMLVFHEYNIEYGPDIVCLLDPRVSGKNTNYIIGKLSFCFSHRVEVFGFSSGIWVGWKDSLRIIILQNHPQIILLCDSGKDILNHIYIYFVYGSPYRSKQKVLWNELKFVLHHDLYPCLFMWDFKAILSPNEKEVFIPQGKDVNFLEIL